MMEKSNKVAEVMEVATDIVGDGTCSALASVTGKGILKTGVGVAIIVGGIIAVYEIGKVFKKKRILSKMAAESSDENESPTDMKSEKK